MKQYFSFVAMFLLGQALHLLVVKIPSLSEKAKANNQKFIFNEWFFSDWYRIVGLNILGSIVLIGLDEVTNWIPLDKAGKLTFALFGFVGNSIVMRASKYEAKIMRMLDIKSNISEIQTGPTEDVQDLILKGTRATGEDITKPPTI